MQYTHQCSCGEKYTDNDPDLYFCEKCVEQRKIIAKQVDKKMANFKSSKPKSEVQVIESLKQTKGLKMRGMTFINASDLGI